MTMWTLREATQAVGGALTAGDATFNGVVTDSRRDCSGKLFVALSGDNFDGHDYVAAAADAGAAAALVSRPVSVSLPQWVVTDTRIGLGHLAGAWRARFGGRVIAITGSNGKTTTKEMLAAICRQVGSTAATAGNLNNAIGLPLTLLSARDEDFLILEMGANHPGEIAMLTEIARPDVAVITNAGRAHLEGFGTLEGVARAKGEIALGLTPNGTFVFMAGTPWTSLWQELAADHATMTFGAVSAAAVRTDPDAITTRWDAEGFRTEFQAECVGQAGPIRLGPRLAGRHNVSNALAAAAAALALGLPMDAIARGLDSVKPVRRRLEPKVTARGWRLIDDSYNANPDSLAAAIDVLTACEGRPVLVLGDFGELGSETEDLHKQMGLRARTGGVEKLFALGDLAAHAAAAFGQNGKAFSSRDDLLAALEHELSPDDVLLVKGSRLAAMDRIVDALCTSGEAA